jgi:uncharacterized protein
MRVGFNFTLGETFDMVQRLLAERHIDYCEFLIDNFLHVPPADLARAFPCDTGFHIMYSRFLETDRETLADLAKRFRTYIDALQPMYVSDHVTCFSHAGRQFVQLGEYDYFADYQATRDKIAFWQDALGRQLLLENFPSFMPGGHHAPEFFERLRRDIGVGMLYDASNAVCAEFNCGVPLSRWDGLIGENEHFHVAGYRLSLAEPYLLRDTHDEQLSTDTIAYLKSRRALFDRSPEATMTYERDDEIDFDSVVADITLLRELFERNEAHADRNLAVVD